MMKIFLKIFVFEHSSFCLNISSLRGLTHPLNPTFINLLLEF